MPAGATYDCIATTTLGSNTASVTFSSIPGTYTDLILISFPKRVTTNDQPVMAYPNGDESNNLASRTLIYGDGSSAASVRSSNTNGIAVGFIGTGEPGTEIAHFMNYANTNVFKTVLTRANRDGLVGAYVNLWRSTSAITSLVLKIPDATSFATGSTFTLYGIAAA